MSVFCGFDVAQASDGDYSAFCVIETFQPEPKNKTWQPPSRWFGKKPEPPDDAKLPPIQLHLRHLERLKRGLPYHSQVQYLVSRLRSPALVQLNPELIVDATGVGRPVVELFKQARVRRLTPITITSGALASATIDGYHVPKRDLVIQTQILLQTGRLKIADRLPLKDVFRAELLAFKVKVDAVTANDSYGAPSGAHDDLVLAVSLACWRASQMTGALGIEIGGFPSKPRRFDVPKRDRDEQG
jgi:hypothetical protein